MPTPNTTTLSRFDTPRTRAHNLECATDGQRVYRVRSTDPLPGNLRYLPTPKVMP